MTFLGNWGELANVAFWDFVCIFVILSFIQSMYLSIYGRIAAKHMKNQFNLLLANCLVCDYTLRGYYFLIKYLEIEDNNDFLLAVFLMIGGMLTHTIYQKIREKHKGSYTPSNGDYNFVCIISVIAICIKMWADCVIPISIPIILVLGRLTGWLDTKNPLEILREVKPTRDRITESSLLLLGGMCAIAVAIRKINWKYDIRTLEVIVSFIYGFTILVPYRFFRSLIGKSKNMI